MTITIILGIALASFLSFILGCVACEVLIFLPKKIAELQRDCRWLEAEGKEDRDRILKLEHPKEVKK